MANKNLFTKFASLAMAGALAFSAVPVGGLTGVFAAYSNNTDLSELDGMFLKDSTVWNPTGMIKIDELVKIESGDNNVTTSDNGNELFYAIYEKGKTAKTDVLTKGNYTVAALKTTTAGDYVVRAYPTEQAFEDGLSYVEVDDEFTVEKRDLDDATVNVKNPKVQYNGLEQQSEVDSISFPNIGNVTTSVGGWYDSSYKAVDAGTYHGKVVADSYGSNLDGSKEYDFEITKFGISSKNTTQVTKSQFDNGTGLVNTGDAIVYVDKKAKNSSANPAVHVKAMINNTTDGKVTLENGEDFEVTNYADGSANGVATVSFNNSKNFEGGLDVFYEYADEENDISGGTLELKYNSNLVDDDNHLVYMGATYKDKLSAKVTVNVKGKEKTLTAPGEFYLDYKSDDDDDCIDAGVMTVTAVGTGDYAGVITKDVVIDRRSIDGKNFGETISDVNFNGIAQTPAVTLTDKSVSPNKTLTEKEDFIVNYEGNVNAGNAIANCDGIGNYEGSRAVKFAIKPIGVKNIEFDSIPNQIETGAEIKPPVTGTFTDANNKKVSVAEGVDYTVEYENNTKAGQKGKAKIEGSGNFDSKTSIEFEIKAASYDLANATVELSNPTIPYDGKSHSAVVKSVKVVTDKGVEKTLTNGKDYEVVNTTAKEVGKYAATIQAPKGSDYAGYQTVEFEITGYDVNDAGFSLKKTSVKYNGKNQKPELVVAEGTRYDGKDMVEGTDYEVSGIKNIKNVGKLTVKVTGIGAYAGTEKSLTFKVTKADQPMKVSTKTASVKASKVAKKNQTIKASKVFSVSKNQGSVSYKKTSGNSKIKVASNGKITVKKGLKKGTYKIKVKVTAKGNSNYNSGNKTVKATIKVK